MKALITTYKFTDYLTIKREIEKLKKKDSNIKIIYTQEIEDTIQNLKKELNFNSHLIKADTENLSFVFAFQIRNYKIVHEIQPNKVIYLHNDLETLVPLPLIALCEKQKIPIKYIYKSGEKL